MKPKSMYDMGRSVRNYYFSSLLGGSDMLHPPARSATPVLEPFLWSHGDPES
jgi:hypothetical protein